MAPDRRDNIQELLASWPEILTTQTFRGTARRLRDTLRSLPADGSGRADITSLVRQILLQEEARFGGRPRLRVPLGPGLPRPEDWERALCEPVSVAGALLVTANPWHPPDGHGEHAHTDLRQVFSGDEVRRDPEGACPADPFWTAAFDYPEYLSTGQRQAARAIVTAPPGSTTIVCLPTGQGKTPVALAPALLDRHGQDLTVVVVPTVVLALDFERRVREMLANQSLVARDRRYAYTGGLPDPEKEAVRDAIRSGKQRVLIASPEALVTGLSSALGDAAAAGKLRYLVVDEAHLVEQWGTDFRPEFQTLAAMRRTWLERAPEGRQPATIAMSATLTDHQVRTLADTFAGTPTKLIWASGMRREISYYVESFDDEAARQEAVLEAVALLPRPLVLYASKREDVGAWTERLRNAGVARVAQVTGDSDDEARREVLDGWRGGPNGTGPTRYDVIVATSAFGLGVDMADVRTVVHACLPETIDRYYQEVGRGGRDRNPCLAYLATTPTDRDVARSLNRQIVIGDEYGWERWSAMRRKGTWSGTSGAVPLDVTRSAHSLDTARNRAWNARTLNLMAQSGLIRLRTPEPPRPGDNEDDQTFEERAREFFATAHLRIGVDILEAPNNPNAWTTAVGAQRDRKLAEQKASLDRMVAVLDGRRCVGELIAEHYTVRWDGNAMTTAVSCRGCPHCRATRRPLGGDGSAMLFRIAPDPNPPMPAWDGALDPLTRSRGPSSWLSVCWTNERERRDRMPDLLERLARRGLPIFGGPGLDAETQRRLQDRARPWPVITDNGYELLDRYPGPVVWVLDDGPLDRPVLDRLRSPEVTYLIHPASLPDPDRPGGCLIDVVRTLPIAIALEEL